MALSFIISQSSNFQQKQKAISLLKDYGIYEALNDVLLRFNHRDHPDTLETTQKCFNQFFNDCIFTMIDRLNNQNWDEKNQADNLILIRAALILIIYAQKISRITNEQLLEILLFETLISPACRNANKFIYHLLGEFYKQNKMKVPVKTKYLPEPSDSDLVFFIKWNVWADDYKLNLTLTSFIVDVTNLFNNLGGSEALYDLLKICKSPHYLTVPCEHLIGFMALMTLFHRCNRISCSPSRGLDNFLKNRMITYESQKLPRRKEYRKLLSEALQNEKTRETLRLKLENIFIKYCPDEEHKKVYNKLLFASHCK